MAKKPTYEELEHRIRELEKSSPANDQSDWKIENVFDLLPDLIGYGNLDGYFTKVNPSFERSLGYPESEFYKSRFLAFIHEDDIEKTEKALAEAQTKTRVYVENRYKCKDGSYRWIDWHVQINLNDRTFLAIGRDTTDQIQAQKHASLLDFALDHVSEAAYLCDEDARLHYTNRAASRMLGYDRNELLALRVPDLNTGYDLERWSVHWRELVSKRSITLESRHRTKTGHVFPVEVNANYFQFEGRNYNLALVRDISERKKLEKEIIASRNFLENIINTIADPVFVKDAGGRYVLVNDAICSVSGLSREAILGKSNYDLFSKPVAASLHHADAQVLETGEANENETTLPLPSGRIQTVILRKSRYSDPEGKRFVVGSIHDITDLKRHSAINESRIHLIQFSATHTLHELLEETVNEAQKLTGSLIGFIHFAEEDPNSLMLQNWSTKTKAKFCRTEEKGKHYPIGEAGVWVDCIHQRKPVIHNDYASLAHRKGMPEGHAEVIRELLVPVLRGDKIKAILGIGNKPTDYTQEDVEAVSLLADLAWEVVERKTADQTIRRLNRELRAINRCHQIIMRATDEKALLQEICRIICEEAGYRAVWAGYTDREDVGVIRPVAWAGFEDRQIEARFSQAEEMKFRESPAGVAARRGEIVHVQDFDTDPMVAQWRGHPLLSGLRSVICLPLKDENGGVFGTLSIFSSSINAFTPDETQLMKALADDLSFGILVIRGRIEHRAVDRKLKESERRWELALEAIQIGIWEWNQENDTWYASSNYYTMLGYEAKPGTANRNEWLNRVHPEDRKMVEGKIQALLTGNTRQYRYEARIRHANGTYRWQLVIGSYIEADKEGKGSRMLGIRMDIHEQKQAEEALIEAERAYRTLVENSLTLIARYDSGLRRIYVNPAWEKASGLSRDSVIGIPTENIPLHPQATNELYMAKIRKALATGTVQKAEFAWINARREAIFVDYIIVPEFDPHGKVISLLCVGHDITEQKRLERELLQTKRLEVIGQLAGGVAHEVRNPLNAILSISEALFKEKEIARNPEYQPYIAHIRTQVTRLSKLMSDLLELGKTIRKENISSVPLDQVCIEAIQLWSHTTGAVREHAVVFDCGVESGRTLVSTDREKLQQVIINLIDNARYCSPKGSDIRVSVARTAEGNLAVRVKDAGNGIAPEKIERIFEPFFSLRKGGTGLGLTLVKHFIENMGGTVAIRNNDPPPGCTAELILDPSANKGKPYETESSSHRG